jgi:hypothetical protein
VTIVHSTMFCHDLINLSEGFKAESGQFFVPNWLVSDASVSCVV